MKGQADSLSLISLMIYERIRNLREDKDLTQTDIAKYLHLSQRTYSYYETGEHAIPVEILSRLADYYHTSIDYLVGRTNCKTPYPP